MNPHKSLGRVVGEGNDSVLVVDIRKLSVCGLNCIPPKFMWVKVLTHNVTIFGERSLKRY